MNRILFLCTGNYYRSRFAEALFNALSREQGAPWQARSRGLATDITRARNDGPMSRLARLELVRLGVRVEEPVRWPRSVDAAELAAYEVVVAVDEREHRPMVRARFPEWEERIQYWDVGDVEVAEPLVALQKLRHYVQLLLRALHRRDGVPWRESAWGDFLQVEGERRSGADRANRKLRRRAAPRRTPPADDERRSPPA